MQTSHALEHGLAEVDLHGPSTVERLVEGAKDEADEDTASSASVEVAVLAVFPGEDLEGAVEALCARRFVCVCVCVSGCVYVCVGVCLSLSLPFSLFFFFF